MLKHMEAILTKEDILSGHFGIEREGLRCDEEGKLALTLHPEVFGEKLSNPYITTDFSESQMELITPAFKSLDEAYAFLSGLYDVAVMEIGDEYLWPQSMPCIIPEDKEIPIARFCKCPPGVNAQAYREKLLLKYGGKKQLLSGIHYNFSFDERLIEKLYDASEKTERYKAFKDSIYLKVARNYLRYRWLIIYLLGGTGVVHKSYVDGCIKKLDEVAEDSFTNEGALSYRNGDCGYRNKIELFPDYESVEGYIKSLNHFISEGMIESHKELYSQIRLKAKDNNDLLGSLSREGIHYLEYRSIDINPFDKAGISLEDLNFVHLFNLYLLLAEESDYAHWQEEALENQKLIAQYGQKEIMLRQSGKEISKEQWGMTILEEIKRLNDTLGLNQEIMIEHMMEKMQDYQQT
ncbi:MAG: bifunctional glutamate--cysteine ligase GshA/glutathione synthetase GshB, partial [Niameybacter sp.]